MGIVTTADTQYLFVDTPGFQTEHKNAMNRAMNRVVTDTLSGVDAIVIVVEALKYGEQDRKLLRLIPDNIPVLLVINKIDQLRDKSQLLPFMKEMEAAYAYTEIIPASAEKETQMDILLEKLSDYLPEQAAIYQAGEVTDQSTEFLAAEIIREKIFRLLGDELPYSTSVVVDRLVKDGNLYRIQATIFVDKAGQKASVIGARGTKLKAIGTQARKELEHLMGCKVFLETWVKVKKGWTDNANAIKGLGLTT